MNPAFAYQPQPAASIIQRQYDAFDAEGKARAARILEDLGCTILPMDTEENFTHDLEVLTATGKTLRVEVSVSSSTVRRAEQQAFFPLLARRRKPTWDLLMILHAEEDRGIFLDRELAEKDFADGDTWYVDGYGRNVKVFKVMSDRSLKFEREDHAITFAPCWHRAAPRYMEQLGLHLVVLPRDQLL